MISNDNGQILSRNQDAFFDVNSLNKVKQKGRSDEPAALKEVARQFEAIFVQQMLKSMRAANEVFGKDNFTNSSEMQFHQQFYDQQMSLELTRGQGLGLADALYQQMQKSYGKDTQEAAGELADLPLPTHFMSPVVRESRIANKAAEESSSSLLKNVSGGKTKAAESPEDFVSQLHGFAETAAKELNTSADILLAQAALETGWGKHVIHTQGGENSFNLFNIKAGSSWAGDKVKVSTVEYANGQAEQQRAEFRRYANYEESFADYVRLLKENPRYQAVLDAGTNTAKYAEALQTAGYATDPRYASKIKNILTSEPVKNAAAIALNSSD